MLKSNFWLTALFLVSLQSPSFAADSISTLENKAAQGDISAQVRLGSLYASCTGVPCNAGAALKWLRKAADRGSAEAAYDIGNLYVSPILLLNPASPLQQDSKDAVKWWRQAAERGYVPAQNKLGQVYQQGLSISDFSRKYRRQRDVVHADYTEALKWYSKAAAQGDARSAAALGDMYAQGQGVQKDPVQAYVWYSRSPSVSAARARDLLNKMTPGQATHVQNLTKGWKPAAIALIQKPTVPAGLLANPFKKSVAATLPAPAPVIRTSWQSALSAAGVGDRMPDGTIYLGKFRSIHWFVMDKDARRPMSYDEAQKYAKNLKAYGHADWVIPDKDILQQMFGNRHKGAFNGSYDERDNYSSGWYWSSTQSTKLANNRVGQWFNNGNSGWIPARSVFSVRLVRGVAQ